MTKVKNYPSEKDQDFEINPNSNEHLGSVDSSAASSSDSSDLLAASSSNKKHSSSFIQIPANGLYQQALEIISQPIPMSDVLACDMQLKRINEMLSNAEQKLSQDIQSKLQVRVNQLIDKKFQRFENTIRPIADDVLLLNTENKKLLEELRSEFDNSILALRRSFISHVQRYFSVLSILGSGYFTPHDHKLERAEQFALGGHTAHAVSGSLESFYKLVKENMPRVIRNMEPALSCAFSIVFPFIPIISGFYSVAVNERLIMDAKQISHNVSNLLTFSESEFIYDALFCNLCHYFKDQIKSGLPNIVFSDNKTLSEKTKNRLGYSNAERWGEALSCIALFSLSQMPLKENIADVNSFIDEWKSKLNELIKYRGGAMPNHAVVKRKTNYKCALEVKLILSRKYPKKMVEDGCEEEITYDNTKHQNPFLNNLANDVFKRNKVIISSFFRSLVTSSGDLDTIKDMNYRLIQIFNLISLTDNISNDQFNVINALIFEYLNIKMAEINWHKELIQFVSQYNKDKDNSNVRVSLCSETGKVLVASLVSNLVHQKIEDYKQKAAIAKQNEENALQEKEQALTDLQELKSSMMDLREEFAQFKANQRRFLGEQQSAEENHSGSEKTHPRSEKSTEKFAHQGYKSQQTLFSRTSSANSSGKRSAKTVGQSSTAPKDSSAASSTQPSPDAVEMRNTDMKPGSF